MDYNPFDPVERAEAMRDEIIGLRTSPEVGFFNSEWYIKSTQEGNFPEIKRSLFDYLLFRKRWHKEARQTPEGYITQFLSKNHFQLTTFKDEEKLRIIRGNICLEFAIDDYREKVSKVKFDNELSTTLRKHAYNLSYLGWKQQNELSLGEIVIISNPDTIYFVDTGNKW